MIDNFTDHEETMPEGEETVATGDTGDSESVQEDLVAGGADDAIEDSADSVEPHAEVEVEESTPAAVMSGIIKPEESDDDEMAHEWYVVKVANGREDTLSRKVERKLALSGLDKYVRNITVPKQKVIEIKEGKKRVREQKLYQGYFFMECQLVDEIWYLLREVQGVGSFVGGKAADKPMPMTPDEVRKLRDMMEQRESEAAPELKIDVKKNDSVKVKDGPFENFEGIVEEVQPKTGKLRVMVTIFGQDTPVDLEYWQVEKT
ncbi:MAG: transcription termination/antitermination protein NusG [Planctomycetota bacterium]